MGEPVVERRSGRAPGGVERRGGGRAPGGVERRKRRADPWRRVLTVLAYVVYPLLILNVFIFLAVASEDQKAKMAGTMERNVAAEGVGTTTAAQEVSGWVHMVAFLPVRVLGVGIGVAGIALDRKRARRRTDASLMTPLVLVVVSVAGLFLFFLARALMG